MDANTRFILKRIDALREEIQRDIHEGVKSVNELAQSNSKRISEIEKWQAKLALLGVLAGGLGSLVLKIAFKI